MAVREYKKEGGGYTKPRDNNNSLVKWTNQNWGTKSGLPSSVTGERYLPEKAIKALSDKEYNQSSKKKREDTKKGIQYSQQPDKLKNKTRLYRL
jgi:hypothetical protein